MRYYPIAVDTKGKNILVAGGGRAAYLKLKSLVSTCALTTVISDGFCKEISELKKLYGEKLILCKRKINKENIDLSVEYSLIFVCTDDSDLNEQLCKYYRMKNVPVMRADNREDSDFITSAVLERENITIAFNTEGRSPTAAKLMLKETEKILTGEFLRKIELLCLIRVKLSGGKQSAADADGIRSIMDGLAACSVRQLEEKLMELNEDRRK